MNSTACLNLLPPLTGWMPAAAVPLHARQGTWESSQGVREYMTASQHELYCMMRHPVAFYATLSAATSSFFLTIALSMRAPYWDQLILKCLRSPPPPSACARLLARGAGRLVCTVCMRARCARCCGWHAGGHAPWAARASLCAGSARSNPLCCGCICGLWRRPLCRDAVRQRWRHCYALCCYVSSTTRMEYA